MIVNGFCKEVFRELPMEFAVEAGKLFEVSLEGGWMSLLAVKDLHANVGEEDGQEILKGLNLRFRPAKYMRLWVLMALANQP